MAEAKTIDRELIELAKKSFAGIPETDENHTVAAAVRTHSGNIFVALNVYHFTGGPCAELAVLGTAAAGGVLANDMTTMVAVARRPGNVFHVINPCGRCRQVMLDYNPNINVIVQDEVGKETVVRARDLVPFAYIWEEGVTGRKEEEAKKELLQ
jgi:cytidine deaminase